VFRRLHSKYLQADEKSAGKTIGKHVKQRRSGNSRVTRSNARSREEESEVCNWKSQAMWTEKYKPTCVDDLIGNRHSIDRLKRWLESWKHYSDEVQHGHKESGRNGRGKGI
jgi:replication factor C subunit 1